MVEEQKTQLPENIKKSIAKLAAATNIDAKELLKQMKEIMDTDPTIQAMTNKEHQIIFAHTLLVKRYSMTGGAVQMFLRPLLIPRARINKDKKYVGNIGALVRIITREKDGKETVGDVQFACGTLWEKAADAMRHLSPDKIYKTALTTKEGKNGLILGGNDAAFAETTEVEMPTGEQFFKDQINSKVDSLIVPLDELHLNNKEDETDFRIIKGLVMASSSGTSPKMGEFGLYNITDDSYIGKGNFPIFVNPEDILYGMASQLYFIGPIDRDEAKDTTRFNCYMIVPIPGIPPIPKEEEPKPVESKPTEEVSLDDIGEDLEEETTPETTEEKPAEKPKEEPKSEPVDDDFAI